MLKRIATILGYLFATVLIIGGTVVLVAMARGYSYDFKTNRFIVNGLVIFDSQPRGASIFVNSKQSRRKTPYRTTLESGVYSFEVSRDGYRPWRKDMEIIASQVTWAQYIVLFPNEIKSSKLYKTQQVSSLTSTPDGRNFAYIQNTERPSVWRFKAGDSKATRVYEAAAAEGEAPAETLSGLSWSDDGERLMIATMRKDKPHHLVLTSDTKEIIDLTAVFGFQLSDVRFNPANSSHLYWLSPEGLRRLDLSSRTISAVLADKVAGFGFGGGKVFYVQSTELGKSLWELGSSDRKQRLIESLVESPSYQIAYTTYEREPLLAVIPSSTQTLTLYTHLGESLISKVITKQASNMSFNNDGRFLAYWTANSMGTYDLEKSRRTNFRKSLENITHARWFDNYHLLVTHADQASVVEFDGGNPTVVTSILAGTPALATPEQKELIYISSSNSTEGPRLYQAKLR